MALKTIEQEWTDLAGFLFDGIKPSAVQVHEMKKAFFCGAWMVMAALEEIGEPHVSEAEACAYLEARRQEVEEFKRRMVKEQLENRRP
jgi:hypothetical protein